MEKGLQTRVYLQVRKSRVPGEEEFEHNWYVIDESMSCISEEPRLSTKLPRDTISACYDPTTTTDVPTDDDEPIIFLCGGRRFFTDTDWNYQGISSDHENPMSSQVWSSHGISHDFNYTGYYPQFDYFGANHLWFQSCSMNLARTSFGGCALVVDKVLYVFGGVPKLPRTTPWNKLSWAEFYPISGNSYWSPLDPPSSVHHDVGLMPHVSACFQFNLDIVQTNENTDAKGNSILVYFHPIGCIYALLLISKQWIMFDSSFGKSFENLVFLADTNILLATKDFVLYGYDLLSKKWFQDPVKDIHGNQLLLPMLQNQDQTHSFHLVPLNSSCQGNLCMLWLSSCNKLSPFHISCMKFTVYRTDSSLVAKVESSKDSKPIDAEALVCCLPLKLQGPSFNPRENDPMDCYSDPFEELKYELRDFDKDDNGFVSAADLREVMKKHGEILTDEEFNEMLRNAYVDRDSPINYRELLRV